MLRDTLITLIRLSLVSIAMIKTTKDLRLSVIIKNVTPPFTSLVLSIKRSL
jgi:hypothetical protein